MNARRRWLATGAVFSACAAMGVPALAGSHQRTAGQNHQAAARDAARLLDRVQLPPGATRSSQEPAGDGGVLADPGFTMGVTNLVDRYSWWTVDEPMDKTFRYIRAHPPQGGTEDTTASGGNQQPRRAVVGFSFSTVGRTLGVRELVVELVRLNNGSTGVRADGEVQWIIPRPASEKVPSHAHVIDVVRRVPGQPPSVFRKVTKRSQVRKIVALIDRLPVLQPGVWHCPSERVGVPIVTFTFRAKPHGPPLARARVRSDVYNNDTGCEAMSFEIRGNFQHALVYAARFLRAVQQLLGVQLTERPVH